MVLYGCVWLSAVDCLYVIVCVVVWFSVWLCVWLCVLVHVVVCVFLRTRLCM